MYFGILINIRFTYSPISCRDVEAYHMGLQIYCGSYFNVATVKRITYRSIAGAISVSRRWSVSHTDQLHKVKRITHRSFARGEAYHKQIYCTSYFDVANLIRFTYRTLKFNTTSSNFTQNFILWNLMRSNIGVSSL